MQPYWDTAILILKASLATGDLFLGLLLGLLGFAGFIAAVHAYRSRHPGTRIRTWWGIIPCLILGVGAVATRLLLVYLASPPAR